MSLKPVPNRQSDMFLDSPHILMPGWMIRGSTLSRRYGSSIQSFQAPSQILRTLNEFDGTLTLRQWIDLPRTANWKHDSLPELLQTLIKRNVLAPLEQLPHRLWGCSPHHDPGGDTPHSNTIQTFVDHAQQRLAQPANDSAITLASGNAASELHKLLRQRLSKRTFGAAVMDTATLSAILWAAAGTIQDDSPALRGTAPSAGALYPLRHFYVNLKPSGPLGQGVYALSASPDAKVHFTSCAIDLTRLTTAFASPHLLQNAQGILVIAADFAISASKYGARSLSYVPLEAGHVAQNVLLAASACRCHALEIGNFLEDELTAVLNVGAGVVPIIAIVLGTATTQNARKAVEFEWVSLQNANDPPPFFLCRTRQDSTYPWSWGRDSLPEQAHLKATMESHEYAALRQPTALFPATFHDAPGAVHPHDILAYESRHYELDNFPYRHFDPDAMYLWKNALDVFNDKACSMLADLVYFESGLTSGQRPAPYTSATRSGVASHHTIDAAIERATLELIEHDTFVRFWLGTAPQAPYLNEHYLPMALQSRLARLRAAGMRVAIRDITQHYCPVIFCFAQSQEHHFTCVATGAAYTTEHALDHALMELEAQAYEFLNRSCQPHINIADIHDAADHARLYAQRRYYRKADYLCAPSKGQAASLSNLAQDWSQLRQSLSDTGQRLIIVNLSQAAATGIHTVRAFVPGLIPIAFGTNKQPTAHPAYRALLERFPKAAKVARFPHPFY